MAQQAEGDENKLTLDAAKLMVDAQKNIDQSQNETDRIFLEAQKTLDAQKQATDKGYQEGVNDGVDAAYGER
jgi:hypothetical protein